MDSAEYWQEAFEIALDEMDLYQFVESLTDAQRKRIGESLAGSHENYGMAFYTPPPSDRYNEIEREWKAKLDAIKREYESYQKNAEDAVRKALKQHYDANVSIGEHGEVFRHGGRTEQIQ